MKSRVGEGQPIALGLEHSSWCRKLLPLEGEGRRERQGSRASDRQREGPGLLHLKQTVGSETLEALPYSFISTRRRLARPRTSASRGLSWLRWCSARPSSKLGPHPAPTTSILQFSKLRLGETMWSSGQTQGPCSLEPAPPRTAPQMRAPHRWRLPFRAFSSQVPGNFSPINLPATTPWRGVLGCPQDQHSPWGRARRQGAPPVW